MEDENETASLRQRRKKSSSISLSCCFHGPNRRLESYDFFSSPSPSPDVDKSSPSLRSPSSWFRSKGHELPEAKGRCRKFMSRMGRHPRRHSGDFSYDPLSYALNFDEGSSDDAHIEDFSSRLPVSPTRLKAAAPRLRSLELPSPAGRSFKGPEATAAAPIKAERRSVDSPTARTSGVERQPREIPVE